MKILKKQTIEDFGISQSIIDRMEYKFFLGITLGKNYTWDYKDKKVTGIQIENVAFNSPLSSFIKEDDFLIKIIDKKNEKEYEVKDKLILENKKDGTIIDLAKQSLTDFFDFEKQNFCFEVVKVKRTNNQPEALIYKYDEKIEKVYITSDSAIEKEIERELIKKIPFFMNKKVYDQPHAIESFYPYIKLYLADISSLKNPICSFLLAGPTGTGKTEFAESLGRALDFNVLRIAMSDFQDDHSSSGLIGSPPSYIGYNDKTRLEKFYEENSKGILLLDEFEKASPKIQRVFLEAMDNGVITLMNGKKIDFSQTIIIMTSNAGISCKNTIKIANDRLNLPEITFNKQELLKHFLPEFVGRLTGIIEFKPLTVDTINKILDKFVYEYNQDYLSEKNTKLELTHSARNKIIELGFSPVYGARPMKNVFMSKVCLKIADLMIFEDHIPEKIIVDYVNEDFVVINEMEKTENIITVSNVIV